MIKNNFLLRMASAPLFALFIASGACAQEKPKFAPPSEDSIPADKFGDLVRAGKDLFEHTDKLRGRYVGNGLKCVNCHLNAGRRADSSPLWGLTPSIPPIAKRPVKWIPTNSVCRVVLSTA